MIKIKSPSNDLKLFKIAVKVIISDWDCKEDFSIYCKCVEILRYPDFSERLMDKCKDFVIEEIYQANIRHLKRRGYFGGKS